MRSASGSGFFAAAPSGEATTRPSCDGFQFQASGTPDFGGGGDNEPQEHDDPGVSLMRVKGIDHQYFCRILTCLGATAFAGLGGFLAYLGGYLSFAAPRLWLPLTVTDASAVSLGSFAAGLAFVTCGLVGIAGAYLRKKPLLCLFGLIVLVVLTGASGGVAIIWETQWSLQQWKDGGYLFSTLDPVAVETLRHLHTEVAGLYAFCRPVSSEVAALKTALDSGNSPTTAFTCASATLAPFEAWAGTECFNAALFADATESSQRVAEINACRADLAATSDAVRSGTGDASWLFCACARPLTSTISERWFTVILVVGLVVVGYLTVLVCILCAACKGADRLTKRKKKQKLEKKMRKQMRVEAGGASLEDDDVL